MRCRRAAARFVSVVGLVGMAVVLGGADEPVGGGCGPGGGGTRTEERTTVTVDDEGGANANEQVAGNNDRGGADLSPTWGGSGGSDTLLREAAVDPTGAYFLSSYLGQLVHWRIAAPAFEATVLAAGGLLSDELEHQVRVVPGITSPARIAFGNGVARFYVTSKTSSFVRAFDPDTLTEVWSYDARAQGDGARLYVSPDDRTLVVVGPDSATLLDTGRGLPIADWMRGAIVDVDYTPDGRRVVLTLAEHWELGVPSTHLVLLDTVTATTSTVEVPNCAANLVLTPDGRRAFLAPTRCGFETTTTTVDEVTVVDEQRGWDPVSVVDLERGVFVKNLPGFGPVALTRDGSLGLAFINTNHLAEELFDHPSQIPSAASATYHAMIFHPDTLEFDTLPIGDVLPRYAMLPDGRVALLDGDRTTTCFQGGVSYACGNDDFDNRTRVLSLASRRIDELEGPLVSLNQYAVTADSERVFVLQSYAVYVLSIPLRAVRRVPVDYSVQTVNVTPDGRRLLLLDLEGVLHVFDAERGVSLYHVAPPDPDDRAERTF